MVIFLQHIAVLLWIVFLVAVNVDSQTTRSSNVSCIDNERWALLEFKTSLNFNSTRHLSDWSNENMDCCRWKGIRCSKSGNVVTLDLHRASDNYWCDDDECMRGEISPSLLHLHYLNYLDLSNNGFIKVPEFVGSLKRLRYLNFSYNPLTKIVPHQLGNLSVLETLDLNNNEYDSLQVDSVAWISKLTSLKYLDLSGTNISKSEPNLAHSISKLPHLENLYLRDCDVTFSATTKINASTSLEVVDLHGNSVDPTTLSVWLNASVRLVDLTISGDLSYGPIPDFLTKLVSIKHLQMSRNEYEGAIPETFSNLSNLLTLDLSYNRLNKNSGFFQSGSTSLRELDVGYNFVHGHLPNLSKFPSLEVLNLGVNKFEGSLKHLLWPSPNLSILDVSSNQLYGTVTEAHFRNLSGLQVLRLYENSLKLNFSTSFRPPFQLSSLMLGGCKLGEGFPLWLRTQKNLTSLDISNSGIFGVVPTWFWDISSRLQYLNVSHNSLAGTIPPNSLVSCLVIVLSFNKFHGPVPTFSRELLLLDLSSNAFFGGLSFLCGTKAAGLYQLDLSDNLLSGKLPNCWETFQELYIVNLNNNNFTGFVPSSMGKLNDLQSLGLRNNSFFGPMPQPMENCIHLVILDFGENQFSGSVPKWIGKLKALRFLRLDSNKFGGKIPSSLCNLNLTQILDLSFNNLSGTIPSCLSNFKVMADKDMLPKFFFRFSFVVPMDIRDVFTTMNSFTAWVFWKGLEVEFKNVKNIKLLKLIDLSSNRLHGSFPLELTSLHELISLNLSHNNLIGPIPDKIGEMRRLESLDLSGNQLSGEIPWSMSNLTTLSYLDLSYNNLTGSIPISTQLQSFDATKFMGNLGLCGAPLPNSCHRGGKNVDYDLPSTEERDSNDNLGMYISIALGFVVGFWGVCGTLLVKDSWRLKYFQILDLCKERFLVALLISFKKMRRIFAT